MRVGCNVEVPSTYHRTRGKRGRWLRGTLFMSPMSNSILDMDSPTTGGAGNEAETQRELRGGMGQFLSMIMPP